jgi:D-glycero-alpha-D-manno-heptose-7-phosphate kinase
MFIRSRVPLRLGLAGGGTDVSPYCDIYGGAVLNATIDIYAYSTIRPLSDQKITFKSIDKWLIETVESALKLEEAGGLILFKGVYNRIVADFSRKPLSFENETYVEAPAGSGLGSSSAVVVALVGVFKEWLNLPLGEYEVAKLAYEIERKQLKIAGGKQDQFATTFGGFNFIEFYDSDRVIVNPLRIERKYVNELEFNLLLYYTGTSRLSSKIIEVQQKSVLEKKEDSIEAMHKLKEQAFLMKEALLKGKLNDIGEILNFGWKYKKRMANEITNPLIDEIYEAARKAGASGGKVSGAGGGGFMMLYCPNNSKFKVIEALKPFKGEARNFHFTEEGLTTWRVND